MQRAESPWPVVLDFFRELASEPPDKSPLDALCEKILGLIPGDRGVSLLEMRQDLPHCVRAPDYFKPVADDFNNHYNRVAPVWPVSMPHCLGPVAWEDFGDNEYNIDFNRPLGIAYSVGIPLFNPATGRGNVVALHRSRNTRPFGQWEIAVAECLCEWIVPIYSLWCEAGYGIGCDQFEHVPRAISTRLTKREAEVASLLLRRLTIPQIAERLVISRRTAETHTEHIYRKLDVSSRHQFLRFMNESLVSADSTRRT